MKTRKLFSVFAIILTLAVLYGCSSTKVVADIDNTVDFAQIKTFEFYGWTEGSDSVLNRFDKERIEQSFIEEARRRGLTEVESDGDAIVSLYLTWEIKTQQTATTTTTGMGTAGMGRRGMRSPGWGWGMGHSVTHVQETQYVEGSIMIEMFDPDTKHLIWQAIGTKRVTENPQKKAKDIPKKIAAIMYKYPVKRIE